MESYPVYVAIPAEDGPFEVASEQAEEIRRVLADYGRLQEWLGALYQGRYGPQAGPGG